MKYVLNCFKFVASTLFVIPAKAGNYLKQICKNSITYIFLQVNEMGLYKSVLQMT